MKFSIGKSDATQRKSSLLFHKNKTFSYVFSTTEFLVRLSDRKVKIPYENGIIKHVSHNIVILINKRMHSTINIQKDLKKKISVLIC